jgi:hypothetical protein
VFSNLGAKIDKIFENVGENCKKIFGGMEN